MKLKFLLKEFDCWVDQDVNVVDLSKPLERNVILTAQYKFNKKKAVAVGLGAAVGTAAYIADLAVPTPVPVVSMVGAAGFGLGAKFQGKNLKNLQADVISQANEITAFDEIPEELLEEIEETKKSGYLNTFFKNCGYSMYNFIYCTWH